MAIAYITRFKNRTNTLSSLYKLIKINRTEHNHFKTKVKSDLRTLVSSIILKIHHANMSVQCAPYYSPLLHSKTGVDRGMLYIVSCFCSGTCIRDLMFGAEMGKLQNLSAKDSRFCSSERLLYISWACFRHAIINSRFFLYFFQIHCGTSTVERHEILKFGNRPLRHCIY